MEKDILKYTQQVSSYIDNHRDEMVSVLKELVKIPSVAAGEEQEQCQILMEKYLSEAGAKIDKWIPDWDLVKKVVYPNTGESIYQEVEEQIPEYLDVREKVSVLAGTIEGKNPGKTLLFNGHIDVAGIGDPREWKYNPWGEEAEGRLYGRGTADQKGGVVASLFAVKAVLECVPDFHGRIHLVITPEEETGGNGTAASIQRGYHADAAIFTDISNNQVIISNSGIQKFKIDIRGNASDIWHEHDGNAADILAMVLRRIREFEKTRNTKARKLYGFTDDEMPACINTGLIQCGEWIASTPGTASIEGLMAVLPDDDLLKLREEFREAVAAKSDSRWFNENPPNVIFYTGKEGCITDSEEDIVKAMVQGISLIRGKQEKAHYGNMCSDMTYYPNLLHVPSLLFGPGKVLHCPDEYIEISELLEAAKAMAVAAIVYLEYE